jgi:hypothetical protein
VQVEKAQSNAHLQSGRRKSRRKISNDYFEEQMAKHSKKDEENTVKSNQEENDVTIVQEEEEINLDESREKLP